jgi:hypothetical protein
MFPDVVQRLYCQDSPDESSYGSPSLCEWVGFVDRQPQVCVLSFCVEVSPNAGNRFYWFPILLSGSLSHCEREGVVDQPI